MTLVKVLKPPFIYVAGFSTLKQMGCVVDRKVNGKRKSGSGFVLMRHSTFQGIPVIASQHPSGARLTTQSLKQIGKAIGTAARA